VGNRLIGIASSGLHSNGYSLARKVFFDILEMDHTVQIPEFGKTLGEELLIPTKIYADTIQSVIRDLPVHGMAHITGGGIPDNIIRIIPNACQVQIERGSWDMPPVFTLLKEKGNITEDELMRTFNCGIGLVMVVPEDAEQEFLARLHAMDEKAYSIGEIAERKKTEEKIVWK
jgi:phosphoribosylformylglycinamidine cyclo-ligase